MRREEIIAIYQRGPEAVCELVEQLVSAHETQLVALQARVKELEEQLGRNSRNSSKPPSSDRTRQRPSRPKSERAPGAQKGHPGHHLALSETPDEVHTLEPQRCTHCGESLGDAAVVVEERRQLLELPVVSVKVSEYRAQTRRCPRCSQQSRAEFPPALTNVVQYGPRLCAVINYLHNYQLLPQERTSQLMEDLFGHRLSVGSICNMRERCAEELAELEQQLKEALVEAEVVSFDETGFYVNAQRQWLHSASTPELTHYARHAKRGREAMGEIGVLPAFEGTAVHDAYSSYFGYDCRHALCNAHQIRELTAVHESDPDTQRWAGLMRSLLVEIKRGVDKAKEAGRESLEPSRLKEYESRYEELLRDGECVNPPPQEPPEPKRGRPKRTRAQNLLNRLRERRMETLRFMYDLGVPFDNNLAERDLRMLKVQQKISGCFRSAGGADGFCRIRSYISTVRKQGLDVLQALEGVFRGHPFSLTPKAIQVAA